MGAELPLSGVTAIALALTGALVEAGKLGMFLGSRERWSHGAVPGTARRPLRESPFPDGGIIFPVHLFSPLGSRTGHAIVEGLRLEEVATGWVLRAGWERAL